MIFMELVICSYRYVWVISATQIMSLKLKHGFWCVFDVMVDVIRCDRYWLFGYVKFSISYRKTFVTKWAEKLMTTLDEWRRWQGQMRRWMCFALPGLWSDQSYSEWDQLWNQLRADHGEQLESNRQLHQHQECPRWTWLCAEISECKCRKAKYRIESLGLKPKATWI